MSQFPLGGWTYGLFGENKGGDHLFGVFVIQSSSFNMAVKTLKTTSKENLNKRNEPLGLRRAVCHHQHQHHPSLFRAQQTSKYTGLSP